QRSNTRHIVANVRIERLELDFSWLDTLDTNFRLQLGVSAGVCDRFAERVQHPLRRLSRRENAVPSGVLIIHTLGQGARDRDRLGDWLAGRDGKRAQSAVLQWRQYESHRYERGLNASTQKVGDDRRAHGVRNVYQVDTGLPREIGPGEMRGRADAGGSVVDFAGLRSRQRHELLEVGNPQRWRHDDDGGRFADQRHPRQIRHRIAP